MGSMSLAAAPIGMAFGGPIADSVGIQPWFLIAGIPTVLIGLTAFFLPGIMRIEDPESRPGYEEKAIDIQSNETDG